MGFKDAQASELGRLFHLGGAASIFISMQNWTLLSRQDTPLPVTKAPIVSDLLEAHDSLVIHEYFSGADRISRVRCFCKFNHRLAFCCLTTMGGRAMIPVSTSVLMVLLKPLLIFSAVQRVFGFGQSKGNNNESSNPEL